MMVVRPDPRDAQSDQASLERDLRRLETDLRQLERDYTMFFADQRPRPPVELRARVEAIIRRWDRVPIQGSTERFRYNTLQLRFRTFADLWIAGCVHEKRGVPGRSRVCRERFASVRCSMPGSVAWPSSIARQPSP